MLYQLSYLADLAKRSPRCYGGAGEGDNEPESVVVFGPLPLRSPGVHIRAGAGCAGGGSVSREEVTVHDVSAHVSFEQVAGAGFEPATSGL